jgi:glutamate synthase domain-containing protein 1
MEIISKKNGQQLSTEAWREVFLHSFKECGNIRKASEDAGITRQAVYYAHKRDPAFRVLYDEAREESIERLEEVARKRAKDSSDNLLIFLLKSMRPEVYREVVRNENINVNMNANLERLDRQLTDSQIDELLEIVEAKKLALEGGGGGG